MLWVTWRQHKVEGLWVLIATAVMASAATFVTYELSHPGCPAGMPGGGICLNTDIAGTVAQWILRVNLVNYGLVILPALAGAFIGAPLVAREIENGTHRLAWTQGVTRVRWIFAKLSLLFVPLVVAAALVGILEVFLINSMGSAASHWAWFDQQAPLTAAATVFALALGVAAGALIGRSIPAMAATLVGVVGTRFTLAVFVRAHYMSPVLFSSHDPFSLNGSLGADSSAWWLDQPSYQDGAGHTIGQLDALRITGGGSPTDQATYWKDHGISIMQYYQPGDRFWTFQAIESGILLAFTAVLLGLAIYWVTRRVS
jgi:ABC-type transport system involved in multi-copper enzyme maturation permease subunit